VDGTPFGRYQLIALLGSGGMGDVWRALDTRTDRMVAIKVLHAHFAKDATFEERFRREAHAAARLNNPHVIPIHDYGEIDGKLFVDMRLVEGHDLHDELARGPLTPERAVAVVDQIADALEAAHRIGLVHRDVKPSNILLDGDFAYLIDFGLARAISDTGLTITGTAVGTMDYMAPERFESKPADARSDVYSLACVLYQCLVGAKPFPTGIVEGLIAAHMFTSPPRPSEQREGVSASFDHVIAVGMAKDPDQRFATAKELAAAARDALAGRAPPTVVAPLPSQKATEPPPAAANRTRWVKPAAIVAAVVLLGAIAVAVVMLTGGDTGKTVATSSSSSPRPTATGTTTGSGGVRPTLTGQWTGRATGDQQDVLVVVDIVDGPTLTGNLVYPEIPCTGTWEQTGTQGSSRIVTETITSGTCVSSTVTLTPRIDGGLDFRSVYYSESQHRDFTIFATLYRA
jgi:serine/threonine protein kinase, bacterial